MATPKKIPYPTSDVDITLPRILSVDAPNRQGVMAGRLVPYWESDDDPLDTTLWDVKDGDPFFVKAGQWDAGMEVKNAVEAFGDKLASADPAQIQVTFPDYSTGDTLPLQAADGTALSCKQWFRLVLHSGYYGPYDGGTLTLPFYATFLAHYEGTGIRLDKVTSAVLADIPNEAANAYEWEVTPHYGGVYGAINELWQRIGDGHVGAEHTQFGGHVPAFRLSLGCKDAVRQATSTARNIDGLDVEVALLDGSDDDLLQDCTLSGSGAKVDLSAVAAFEFIPLHTPWNTKPRVGDVVGFTTDPTPETANEMQMYVIDAVSVMSNRGLRLEVTAVGDQLQPSSVMVGVDTSLRIFPQAPASGGPTVTTDATTGNTPATGPTTGAEGDVFVNTGDGLIWIHDGTAWQPITPRTPRTYFGTAGAGAPGAQAPAVTPTGTGDLYLDTSVASGSPAIYEADAAGTAWNAAPSITMESGDQFFDIPNTDVYREI